MTDTADKVDAFLEKLVALGGELVDAAKPLAHVATDAVLTAVYFQGMFGIIGGVVAGAIVPLAVWGSIRLGTISLRARYAEDLKIFGCGVGSLLCGAAAFVSALISLSMLVSADTWMALLRPDAYLAAKALGL